MSAQQQESGEKLRWEIHDFLAERGLDRQGVLSALDDWKLAEAVVDYAHDFFVEPLVRRLLTLLNDEYERFESSTDRADYRPERPPVTFEDIGVLLAYAGLLRDTVGDISRDLDTIEELRHDLLCVAEAGRVELEPPFTRYGARRDPDELPPRHKELVGAR